MPFKIATQFQPKDAVPVAIVAPTDLRTPTGITITLAGRYTDTFAAAQAAAAEAVPAEGTEQDALKHLAAHAIVAWTGVEDDQGAPVAVSPAQALALFDAVPWLYEQVRRALLDLTRFFETAKAS